MFKTSTIISCYWQIIRGLYRPLTRPPKNKGPKIGLLLFSATFHFHETFTNIIIARSLMRRGARPVILLPGYLYAIDLGRITPWRTRTKWWQIIVALRLAGVPYTILSDQITSEDIEAAQGVWNNLKPPGEGDDPAVNSQDLGERHAQISSLFYDPNHDSEFPQKLRKHRACAQLTAICSRRVFESAHLDKVLVFNGKSLYSEAVRRVAESMGIAVDTWELALRRGTLIFSHGPQPACWGPSQELFEKLRHNPFPEDKRKQIIKFMNDKINGRNTHTSMIEDGKRTSIPFAPSKGKRGILLLANIAFDTASIGRNGCFHSIAQWLSETVRHYANDDSVHLVIKPHPYLEVANIPAQPIEDFLKRALGSIPTNTVVIKDARFYPNQILWAHFDHVVVFNSTSALDLAFWNDRKAVVVAEAHFQGYNFTLDPKNRDEYFLFLDKEKGEELDNEAKEILIRYLYFQFFRVNFYTPLLGDGPLKKTRIPKWLKGPKDIAPGAEPSLDLICNGLISGADYLEPDNDLDVLPDVGKAKQRGDDDLAHNGR